MTLSFDISPHSLTFHSFRSAYLAENLQSEYTVMYLEFMHFLSLRLFQFLNPSLTTKKNMKVTDQMKYSRIWKFNFNQSSQKRAHEYIIFSLVVE